MKKVVYSIHWYKKTEKETVKIKGVGYISDTDLLILATSKDNSPYLKVYEDCIRYCNPIINKKDQFKGCFTQIEKYEDLEYERTYYLWYMLIA